MGNQQETKKLKNKTNRNQNPKTKNKNNYFLFLFNFKEICIKTKRYLYKINIKMTLLNNTLNYALENGLLFGVAFVGTAEFLFRVRFPLTL